MTIDYGWVSESLQATAEKRDDQISSLLRIEVRQLRKLRRAFSKVSETDAPEAVVIRQVGLSADMFRCWRKLEELPDRELDAVVARFLEHVERERIEEAPSTVAATRSRNQRLGKPYVGAARVRPRVYSSGPIPGWWHGGE